jgi:hypothetical protein
MNSRSSNSATAAKPNINQTYKLFLRKDNHESVINNPLPGIQSTPADHMLIAKPASSDLYVGSGYISFFEYTPGEKLSHENFNRSFNSVRGVVGGDYYHLIFIPNTVPVIRLNEESAKNIPTSGRNAQIYDTSGLSKLGKLIDNPATVTPFDKPGSDQATAVIKTSTEEFIYQDENLFSGDWPQGTLELSFNRYNHAQMVKCFREMTKDFCGVNDLLNTFIGMQYNIFPRVYREIDPNPPSSTEKPLLQLLSSSPLKPDEEVTDNIVIGLLEIGSKYINNIMDHLEQMTNGMYKKEYFLKGKAVDLYSLVPVLLQEEQNGNLSVIQELTKIRSRSAQQNVIQGPAADNNQKETKAKISAFIKQYDVCKVAKDIAAITKEKYKLDQFILTKERKFDACGMIKTLLQEIENNNPRVISALSAYKLDKQSTEQQKTTNNNKRTFEEVEKQSNVNPQKRLNSSSTDKNSQNAPILRGGGIQGDKLKGEVDTKYAPKAKTNSQVILTFMANMKRRFKAVQTIMGNTNVNQDAKAEFQRLLNLCNTEYKFLSGMATEAQRKIPAQQAEIRLTNQLNELKEKFKQDSLTKTTSNQNSLDSNFKQSDNRRDPSQDSSRKFSRV